jgi:hypothetical protein
MIIPYISPAATRTTEKQTGEIHLFVQYYVDADETRQSEIRACLHKNIQNPFITKVHLLNERIYKNSEIGAKSPKLVQINIGKRLAYSDVFNYINQTNICGYIVIANADILFDQTLENIRYSDIHASKKVFAQLRYEYNAGYPSASKIFGPRYDSQDSWILHTNHGIQEKHEILFDFNMGTPGCDNKIIYIFSLLGYDIINHPEFIKTYHYHTSNKRNYSAKDVIKSCYGVIVPFGYSLSSCVNGVGNLQVYDNPTKIVKFSDNAVMYKYILSCFAKNKRFVIPRIAGIENIFVYVGWLWQRNGVDKNTHNMIQSMMRQLKHSSGILVRDIPHVIEYSQRYLEAFNNCEMYSGWDKHGGVYPHISQSHDFITATYSHKKMCWAEMLSIFFNIYNTPWTQALRGKRVLLVSPFKPSLEAQIPKRMHLYDGVDLFPECTFNVIAPPQTMGNILPDEEYFGVHLTRFLDELDTIQDTYDVALVSCGGYGNLVCNHIYNRGKSAIYVGGALQMFFGIAGNRWYSDNPEIIEMFLNEHWTRPTDSETPACHQSVERSCYW